ncbi:MAG: hypothetical protein R6U32_03710 [Candidatus Woesearchaeota archaeon]
MKIEDLIKKRVAIAEKRILELTKSDNLKNLSDKERFQISGFYEEKSRNRLETAKLVLSASKSNDKKRLELNEDYRDYAEAVSAAYYSMYYIVHAFLALNYRKKLKEDIRGVHIITEYIILYYLVKTKKLARHLYEEYLAALETASRIQNIDIESFQREAYEYVRKYDQNRTARETFTYKVTPDIEEHNAKKAVKTSEEFINTIRQLMALRS